MHRQRKHNMNPIIQILSQTGMFSGICAPDIERLMSCMDTRIVTYPRESVIIGEGHTVREFGILLQGAGRSFRTDTCGRTIAITLLKPGSEIGVILAASRNHKSPVSVELTKGSSILFISYERLMESCVQNCRCHKLLVRNFTGIVAAKGLVLHERMDCLLKPTVREKVMTYLSRISAQKNSRTFSIPLDRSAMAEYLNTDRSALSRELSKMEDEGLIDYYKNTFSLMKPQ